MLAIKPLLPRPTRRDLLRGAAATGLTLGFSPILGRIASAAEAGPNPFTAYLTIAPDGTVTVLSRYFHAPDEQPPKKPPTRTRPSVRMLIQ